MPNRSGASRGSISPLEQRLGSRRIRDAKGVWRHRDYANAVPYDPREIDCRFAGERIGASVLFRPGNVRAIDQDGRRPGSSLRKRKVRDKRPRRGARHIPLDCFWNHLTWLTCRRPGRGRGVAGWVVRCADRVADREGRGTDRRCTYDRLRCQAGKDPFGPPSGPIRTSVGPFALGTWRLVYLD